MKMAKLRRKVVDLERRLETARAEWRTRQAVLRRLQTKHASFSAPALYGRRGATELRCTQCTTSQWPCATRRALDGLLG